MEALRIPVPIELKGDNDDGNEVDVVSKALDELKGSFDERFAEIEKKSFGRLDKIEARLNRPGTVAANDDKPASEIERKSFDTFLRRGVERMGADEVKTLTVANDASAGYLAPEAFGNEIIKKLVEFSPIRQYARVVSVSAPEIKYPRRLTTTAATWTGETAVRTPSEPSYEQISITPYELATYVPVSQALLEDNAYNLEGELSSDLAEAFGKSEGVAFVNGTGTAQPKGIMKAAGIAEVKTGVAGAFPATSPADVLIGMYHALPTSYAQRGVWLMNRNTIATMRKWKNSVGDYLIVDPLSDGMPITLLGRPIVEAIDMDDIAAIAYPILFGDMQGYRIVDRVSLNMLRDPYSQATTGQVLIHARKRVGADVTNPDRFVKLKVAA